MSAARKWWRLEIQSMCQRNRREGVITAIDNTPLDYEERRFFFKNRSVASYWKAHSKAIMWLANRKRDRESVCV